MTDVCQEIARYAYSATFPTGSKFHPEQFVAIVKQSGYVFDDGFITANMGSYLEFEFEGVESVSSLLIVIKHTYVDSEEEKESATQVRKQIAT